MKKTGADAVSMQRRSTFKRNSKALAGKPADVTDLFEHFAEIKKEQKKKLLLAHLHGRNFPIPAMGMLPVLRYMPTRHLMQRLIHRAAVLHPDFTSFADGEALASTSSPILQSLQ